MNMRRRIVSVRPRVVGAEQHPADDHEQQRDGAAQHDDRDRGVADGAARPVTRSMSISAPW